MKSQTNMKMKIVEVPTYPVLTSAKFDQIKKSLNSNIGGTTKFSTNHLNTENPSDRELQIDQIVSYDREGYEVLSERKTKKLKKLTTKLRQGLKLKKRHTSFSETHNSKTNSCL